MPQYNIMTYSSTGDHIQISAFFDDYPNAVLRAQDFDKQVENDASAISGNYAGIVQLSIRQAFGAMELTISQNSDGSWNTSDVVMFLKGMAHSLFWVTVGFG